MSSDFFLRRVRLRHFKSISACDVELGRLTLLVGRNGSGKSNFLDAIRFTVDALESSLDHALTSRGGIAEVRRRSTGHPHHVAIELEFNLNDRQTAEYGFELGALEKGGFRVKRERLRIAEGNHRIAEFSVTDGDVESSVSPMPSVSPDRLALVAASGLSEFRPAYDALRSMGFYNLNPDQMKEVQSPDAGELLRRDGRNIASVIARLSEDRPEVKARIKDYLLQIVPEVEDFQRIQLGLRETLQFRQRVKGAQHPWKFYAGSMSDGTLRSLGILVAAMQLANRERAVRLVGIEEPETALHPAAAGALMDSLREAATNTQILITTHSPDLVDQFDPETDCLLVVISTEGTTEIGPMDQASLDVVREHLYSAGELLRMDQLQPDLSGNGRQLEFAFETCGDAE